MLRWVEHEFLFPSGITFSLFAALVVFVVVIVVVVVVATIIVVAGSAEEAALARFRVALSAAVRAGAARAVGEVERRHGARINGARSHSGDDQG
jgi:hypothetical protein